eukprot:330575_1
MALCTRSTSFFLGVSWALCSFLSAICIICATCFSCKQYQKQHALAVIGKIYNFMAVSCVLIYTANAFFWSSTCNESSLALQKISMIFYGGQEYCFILILYLRLYSTFKDSIYRLSTFSVRAFVTMFILLPIFVIALMALQNINSSLSLILILMTAITSLFLLLSISGLFIYKLFGIYHASKTRASNLNETFLALVTRNTILTIVSILVSILTVISFGIIATHPDSKMSTGSASNLDFAHYFMYLLDVDTNYICITLAIKAFTSEYYFICGSLDKKCKECCSVMVTKQRRMNNIEYELENQQPRMENVNSISARSVQATKTPESSNYVE